MKRLVVLSSIAALLGLLVACEGLLPEVPTPEEQVRGFIDAANDSPQSPTLMQSYFSPEASDYDNMDLESYWELRFFNEADQPFGLQNVQEGGSDPEFANSTTVTASVTNAISPTEGYPATFVLVSDPDNFFAPPLIRKITVTVGGTDEVIEKVIP